MNHHCQVWFFFDEQLYRRRLKCEKVNDSACQVMLKAHLNFGQTYKHFYGWYHLSIYQLFPSNKRTSELHQFMEQFSIIYIVA
jgi:hypothetical protein